jgi:hypothetical protein
MDRFLTKPLDLEKLRGLLAEVSARVGEDELAAGAPLVQLGGKA